MALSIRLANSSNNAARSPWVICCPSVDMFMLISFLSARGVNNFTDSQLFNLGRVKTSDGKFYKMSL